MTRKNKQNGPIGIFDSGVGGLSVLREIQDQFPTEDLIYIADQDHVPYGVRSREEVLGFSEGIVRYLLKRKSKIIVIACNTASAVALGPLRESNPDTPFVGMEPAVKPAAEGTSSGVVGVLATPATFQGDLYNSTVERFAKGVKIIQDTCPGLVKQIEKGEIYTPETREILEKALIPMIEEGVDEIVMGCTHYPFVIPVIEEIVGERIQVIDPAPAIARQTGRLLHLYNLQTESQEKTSPEFYTTGDSVGFSDVLKKLVDLDLPAEQLVWDGGELRNP